MGMGEVAWEALAVCIVGSGETERVREIFLHSGSETMFKAAVLVSISSSSSVSAKKGAKPWGLGRGVESTYAAAT